jgi:hypothetical protein
MCKLLSVVPFSREEHVNVQISQLYPDRAVQLTEFVHLHVVSDRTVQLTVICTLHVIADITVQLTAICTFTFSSRQSSTTD